MGISLVSTGEATQLPLEIEVEWYKMLNMAMLIYSATFIIHANCFINAITMYWRHSRSWAHKFHIIQTGCAVACHLCRVSDYFWVTNCYFKGYFNVTSYFIGICVMDGLQVYKFNHIIIKQCHRYPHLIKWFNIIGFGYISIITKIGLGFMIGAIIDSTVGVATFCVNNFPYLANVAFLGSDIIYHFLTLLWTIYLISNQYINYKSQYPTSLTRKFPSKFINQIGLDTGILYLIFSDISIICLFGVVYFNATGFVNPEVLMQTKWAIHTKCISEMMQSHTKSQLDHYREGVLGCDSEEQSSDNTLCSKKNSKYQLYSKDTQDTLEASDYKQGEKPVLSEEDIV